MAAEASYQMVEVLSFWDRKIKITVLILLVKSVNETFRYVYVFRIRDKLNLVLEVVLVLESKTKSLLIVQAQVNLLPGGMAPDEFVALYDFAIIYTFIYYFY